MSSGSSIETPARLSPRELEVARMVAEGLTNREIAAKLFLSERTVDRHLEHIREKLGVNTRAQVTAWVVRRDSAPTPARATPAATSRRQGWVFITHPRAWMAAALVLALLAAAIGALRLTAPPPPIIRTFAGDCAPAAEPTDCRAAGDHGPATQAKLSRPTSVAVDSSGVAFIADYANGRIRKVERGVITTVVGGGDKELANGVLGVDVSSKSLGLASTVAVDRQGEVYVLTSRNDRLEIWKVHNLLMELVVVVGPSNVAVSPDGPNLPVGGLAITREGVIYIADRGGNRIWRFDGNQETSYAGTGIDGSHGDNGNAIEAELSNPIGLALDSHENLYIADTGNDRIRKVDHVKETITTVAGGTGNSLNLPFGVAAANDGTILIADTGKYRIEEISPDGALTSVAGTGKWGFQGDDMPATEAEFDVPEGIALTAAGDLYIADTENMRVRVIGHLIGP